MQLFQEAEFWVAVGLAILVGAMIAAKVPSMALKALDARGAAIQAELDEAQRLRHEAEALLAAIKVQRADAERVAAEIMANAQADALRFAAEAAAKLEEQILRRGELAERKIAIAEAQAAADVKAAAADMAAVLAEAVMTSRIATAKSDPLVDQAVAQLASKLQ